MNKLSFNRPRVILLFCSVAISLVTSSASAALFLNFDEVDGDSRNADHENWIDILAVNWNISVSKFTDIGGTKTKSQPVFGDISWTQVQDSSFPRLFSNISKGTLMQSAEIDFTTSNGQGERVYFKLEFEQVQLTNLSLSADSVAQPLISGSFAYDKVVVTYLPQDDKGKQLPEISAEYDLNENSGSAANVASLFAQGLSGPIASPVPLPIAFWLFAPAIVGLLSFRRF